MTAEPRTPEQTIREWFSLDPGADWEAEPEGFSVACDALDALVDELADLRAELAAAREAERTMHEMKERHAGDADYLLRQRNAAFAKGEEYRAKWEAAESLLADTREALKRVAVHIAIRKAERHKGKITGDDCPLCRRDQHELDLIGAALAAAPASPTEAEYERRMTCETWGQYGDCCNCTEATQAPVVPNLMGNVLDSLTEAPQAEPASEGGDR